MEKPISNFGLGAGIFSTKNLHGYMSFETQDFLTSMGYMDGSDICYYLGIFADSKCTEFWRNQLEKMGESITVFAGDDMNGIHSKNW